MSLKANGEGARPVTPAPLTFLSLTSTRRGVPRVPTNEERLRAYRALGPIQLGNALPWKWHKQYAAEAVPGVDYDQQLREGFALKYGSEK